MSEWAEWVKILRGFTKLYFKQMLKVSAFYLEKQKGFIPKKNSLSRCQYQNKKALFTDLIFREGFGQYFCVFLINTEHENCRGY